MQEPDYSKNICHFLLLKSVFLRLHNYFNRKIFFLFRKVSNADWIVSSEDTK